MLLIPSGQGPRARGIQSQQVGAGGETGRQRLAKMERKKRRQSKRRSSWRKRNQQKQERIGEMEQIIKRERESKRGGGARVGLKREIETNQERNGCGEEGVETRTGQRAGRDREWAGQGRKGAEGHA